MRDALGWADALHDFAFHLTANAAEADDLVQETYARALAAAGRFADGGNVKAWLFRILHNAFVDLYRRRRDRRTDGGLDGPAEAALPAGGGAQDELEQRQARAVVGHELEEALMSLTEEARLAVLLDVQGFSEAEMAELLGCAPGTVKSRLFRARAALREKLRDHRER